MWSGTRVRGPSRANSASPEPLHRGRRAVRGRIGDAPALRRRPKQWCWKVTIDSELIAADAERAGLGYWDLLADTLIHEYYHAYDMFTCVCGNPHEWRGQSRSDYEADTSDRAAEKAGALAACLPD